ncbi:hypothetical protein [Candidatus Synchoanobacter obligatus]|uniref:Uncharacterized protein n=1 Tax=Candidatus Synchoanobacter obligatus TaxID=2919597 RepID=A0ABT1L617_9GAMM|nr:hypothetical protein [Candidatus Synchoanobacter obligatus]MCP8352534.1 hypothetical protein [Candidatus Synchoanobacter obligatus]
MKVFLRYIGIFLVNAVTASTFVQTTKKPMRLMTVALDIQYVVQSLCFAFGLGMLLSSVHQYARYRSNAQAHPLARAATTLFVAVMLIGVSYVPSPKIY